MGSLLRLLLSLLTLLLASLLLLLLALLPLLLPLLFLLRTSLLLFLLLCLSLLTLLLLLLTLLPLLLSLLFLLRASLLLFLLGSLLSLLLPLLLLRTRLLFPLLSVALSLLRLLLSLPLSLWLSLLLAGLLHLLLPLFPSRICVSTPGICSNHAAVFERRRPRCRSDGRSTVIGGLAQFGSGAGCLLVSCLLDSLSEMPFPLGRSFQLTRTSVRAPVAAVVAHTVDRDVIDHGRVVGVMNVGHVDVVHRTVVTELSAIPAPAVVAGTAIAVAVIDAAVVADTTPPVAGTEDEKAVTPAPIGGRPQIADTWRPDPGSRHPVVVVLVLVKSPIARGPDVTFAR